MLYFTINQFAPKPPPTSLQTGWNMRDKKIAGGPMTFIRKKDFAFKVSTQSIHTRTPTLVWLDGRTHGHIYT